MTVDAKFADDFNMDVFVVYVAEFFKENRSLQVYVISKLKTYTL